MTTFATNMDNFATGRPLGENGTAQFSTSEDPLVDFFFNTVRSTPLDSLKSLIDAIFAAIENDSTVQEVKTQLAVDLLVSIFQMRATRGMGKGERNLTVLSLVYTHGKFPMTIQSLVDLLPHFGCWKDLLEIIHCQEVHPDLKAKCVKVFTTHLKIDSETLKASGISGDSPKISMAGKWAPREKGTYDKVSGVVDIFSKVLFPDVMNKKARRKRYRKLIVQLTKALKVPEVLMSAQRWAEINFKLVPALCLNKYRKGFLNESLKVPLNVSELETGNRHPKDIGRIKCRQNLVEQMLSGSVNATQLFPHDIVSKFHHYAVVSSMDELLADKQWDAIREDVLKSMVELKASSEDDKTANKVDLGNLVPLVDVSGSMGGQPMEVAIALGILVSEITADCIKNRVLTFESRPRWFKFGPEDRISEKVRKLRAAPWGGTTNFTLALEMILAVVEEQKLSEDQVPDLIVFSDMQFDQADQNFATQYEQIERKFHDLGLRISGISYKPPRIIFWNLRGNSHCGIHAPVSAATENVQLLSGFSPSMLKLVLAGDLPDEMEEIVETVNEDGDVVISKVKRKTTPYDTYRKAIDNANFDLVRQRLTDSTEGVLLGYVFSPQVSDESGNQEKES
jgi:hypothetical protein